ncbi:nucleoside 2-deoxyribosyltransferase [Marinobacter pelagius]|uniref:nucleoside 2-deoxyribosyltransferase n=1 Tax=Marinobacter sp. C7 TaxID=2951363 RepID=UPI001EF14AF9|nr:nucleoside 2-deoxyribosyltransferase [Marinobacter sp. C7]MCG7199646.1 nucleoside 2-deoxyribosyltransferase [Marinobacter sp. C7]
MTRPKRVYLAGPEVFFPPEEQQAIITEKKNILQKHRWEGVDPLDAELSVSQEETKRQHAFRIYEANRELMDSCDAIIANLTPFRGISADPGTVFEVGYMVGQQKPAFGFSMSGLDYRQRAGAVDADGHGHSIEDFGLAENLMIHCGIVNSGGTLITADREPRHRFFDKDIFERCVEALVRKLG